MKIKNLVLQLHTVLEIELLIIHSVLAYYYNKQMAKYENQEAKREMKIH